MSCLTLTSTVCDVVVVLRIVQRRYGSTCTRLGFQEYEMALRRHTAKLEEFYVVTICEYAQYHMGHPIVTTRSTMLLKGYCKK